MTKVFDLESQLEKLKRLLGFSLSKIFHESNILVNIFNKSIDNVPISSYQDPDILGSGAFGYTRVDGNQVTKVFHKGGNGLLSGLTGINSFPEHERLKKLFSVLGSITQAAGWKFRRVRLITTTLDIFSQGLKPEREAANLVAVAPLASHIYGVSSPLLLGFDDSTLSMSLVDGIQLEELRKKANGKKIAISEPSMEACIYKLINFQLGMCIEQGLLPVDPNTENILLNPSSDSDWVELGIVDLGHLYRIGIKEVEALQDICKALTSTNTQNRITLVTRALVGFGVFPSSNKVPEKLILKIDAMISGVMLGEIDVKTFLRETLKDIIKKRGVLSPEIFYPFWMLATTYNSCEAIHEVSKSKSNFDEVFLKNFVAAIKRILPVQVGREL